jgi:secreted trypsin-like serine protease
MRVYLILLLALPAFADYAAQRVVGGSNANIANYPHQLSLRVSNSHSCGASLISGIKAVTAAHCGGGALNTYSVLAGTTDRTVTNCGTCALRSATAFVRHPNYSNNGNTGFPNDIATMRFANIPTNANTNYATMAAANAGNYAGQSCVITGWGRTCGNCGLPNTLQQGTMTVLTNAACANTWGSASVNNGHICIQAPSTCSCNGDSGGPLMCGSTLVGATSWGATGCLVTYPSVYSRISFFRAWIDAN